MNDIEIERVSERIGEALFSENLSTFEMIDALFITLSSLIISDSIDCKGTELNCMTMCETIIMNAEDSLKRWSDTSREIVRKVA